MNDDILLPLTSADLTEERRAALQQLFPDVFTEGRLDVERLRMALGDFAASAPERYGLSWAGKSEAIRAVQSLSRGTLVPAPDESVNFDTTENLILEGDNLEILKLLQKSYHNKVKMIYIDPPYNTGHEFIYPDNFREGLADYLRYSGQVSGEGLKMSANTETDGRYHSKWLTMMYPRLFLAKNLLRDDGVIFVSIDDHEYHNLRALMNEIFGEENLLGAFVWKRRSGSNDAQDNISVDHEYVIIARKSPFYQFGGVKKGFENYKNPNNDSRGAWAPDNLTCNKTAQQRPNLFYPITNPATGITYQCNPNRVWAYEPVRMARIMAEDKVIWPTNENGTPQYKRHLSEVRSLTKPVSTWIEQSTRKPTEIKAEADREGVEILQVGLNQQGTKEFRKLFEIQVFDYPKPVSLIESLLEQATSDAEEDIIFDFFAGSGTTAQAVLEANKKDGGSRKFILAQLPEYTPPKSAAYEAGYKTITEITKERVRRVISRLAENSKADYRGGGGGYRLLRPTLN